MDISCAKKLSDDELRQSHEAMRIPAQRYRYNIEHIEKKYAGPDSVNTARVFHLRKERGEHSPFCLAQLSETPVRLARLSAGAR